MTGPALEIHDQYTLAWALLSPGKRDMLAATAEPFSFADHLPGQFSAAINMPTFIATSPVRDDGMFRHEDDSRHMRREAHDVQRDDIFLAVSDALPKG